MSHSQSQLNQPVGPTNTQSFHVVHDRYRNRLLNSMMAIVRNREAAEDVTATAFASAFEHLASYRGTASLYTWIHAIAQNEARTWLRRRRTALVEEFDNLTLEAIAEPDTLAEALERSECRVRIRQALRRVPALHRRTLLDHFVRGDSVKRIAQRERIPVGTVLSRLFRAKGVLRKAWGP